MAGEVEDKGMNDYISRDELLKLYAPDPDCDKCSVPFPVVRQNILDMPTADVVPVRHGHWYDIGSLSCRCSTCGCKSNKETAFCPNCGAKMDKEREHETD